jgi:hypothetical protein
MDANANNLNWFEIPATDIKRAAHFYETIFQMHMETMEMGGMQMAMFPQVMGSGKAGGGLAQSEMHVPSKDGALIYLNANPAMDAVLERIPGAGGQVVLPKTQISPEIGFMAFFIDSEGNRVGLHSQQ